MDKEKMIKFPLKVSLYSMYLGNRDGNFYIYNTLQNVLIKLNESQHALYEKIAKKARIERSDFEKFRDLIWPLYEYGFILNEGVDEFDIFMDKINKIKYKDDELITAIVLLGCNLNCSYCFEKWHGSKDLNKRIYLSPGFVSRYLNFIERYIHDHQIRHLKVAWFGGEPLLDVKTMISVSERLLSLTEKFSINFVNYIVTNGTLLHLIPESSFRLFNFIQVTLDGTQEVHDKYRIFPSGKGTFNIIYRNLTNIPEDFELVLRINIPEANIKPYMELIDMFAFRSEHTTLDFSPIFVSDSNQGTNDKPIKNLSLEEYFYIEQELMEYASRNGFKISSTLFPDWTNSTCWRMLPYAYHITTEGEAYACVTQLGNRKDYYGFLTDDGKFIISDWNTYSKNKIHSYNHINDECKSCPFAPVCALSCVHKNGCTIFKNKQILLDRLLLLEKASYAVRR